jgi:hypothetical protein
MIRGNKQLLFLLVLISSFFNSCKKYDDGPFLTFRTADSRIVGTWDVEYIYVDNVDSTSFLKHDPCWSPINFLSKQETGTNLLTTGPCFLTGIWSFSDNKNILALSFDIKGWKTIGSFGYIYHNVDWTINKLTNSELWIETNFNNQFTWVHLKKQ